MITIGHIQACCKSKDTKIDPNYLSNLGVIDPVDQILFVCYAGLGGKAIMNLKFTKGEGTGNDFVVLYNPKGRPDYLTAQVVKQLCDRHFGIGADGVLSIEKGRNAPLFMRMINPDGTEAEMCGNGIRVVTAYAVQVLGVKANPVDIETPAGVKPCAYEIRNGTVDTVSVGMGRPRVAGQVVELPGIRFVGWSVSTGNPHFVVPSRDPMQDARRYGPDLSKHPIFPDGTNVEFIKQTGESSCELAVYERGAGITLSCGSGTTAAVAAGAWADMFPIQNPVQVNLPGGTLWVTMDDGGSALLKGPARLVFAGEITL